ncbi:NUDIX hydrolase N-terminal domain-containing protein [uncultured Vagococcus sp.]|nr:NUDIX hydrolase N-terminal domain-containing protein [uncultured Vagococcus sp.]
MGEERGDLSDVLQYAQRIQAIAQSGLTFSTNIYDQERYEEQQTIAF